MKDLFHARKSAVSLRDAAILIALKLYADMKILFIPSFPICKADVDRRAFPVESLHDFQSVSFGAEFEELSLALFQKANKRRSFQFDEDIAQTDLFQRSRQLLTAPIFQPPGQSSTAPLSTDTKWQIVLQYSSICALFLRMSSL